MESASKPADPASPCEGTGRPGLAVVPCFQEASESWAKVAKVPVQASRTECMQDDQQVSYQ